MFQKNFVLICIFCLVNMVVFSAVKHPKNSTPSANTSKVLKIPYGSDPMQYGELRLPKGEGPYPVVVLIHGGCWTSQPESLDIMNAMATALTQSGVATWNIEYRGVNTPAGGWPGTFNDIGYAVDFVRIMAAKFNLNPNRVVIIGHSAGGHLALWASARIKLPASSLLYSPTALHVRGVINLAGPGNLMSFYQMHGCGKKVYSKLIGGSPLEKPEHNQQTSPDELLPFGIKQILISGSDDVVVPPKLGEEYQQKAKQLGDPVKFIAIQDVDHVEIVDPKSAAWPIIKDSTFELLGVKPRD